MEHEFKDTERRITELEELYKLTRQSFLDDYDNLTEIEKYRTLQQLRGLLDDIAKEAGGRAKRAVIEQNVKTDNTFAMLLSGIRGKLPGTAPAELPPAQCIDVQATDTGGSTAEKPEQGSKDQG